MKLLLCIFTAAALCLGLSACAPSKPASSEALTLPQTLAGKRLSVLGDSISSFAGVSNNDAVLASLGANDSFFPQQEIAAVSDTWWQQAVDALGMELLVNNSYSGGWVTADIAGMGGTSGIGRCIALATHAAKPDVIAFFMGANDCRFGVASGSADAIDPAALPLEGGDPPADFATGYATAIVRMQAAYPDAIIYCCTLPAAIADGCNADTMGAYNDVIRAVAAKLGCPVVDFAADSGITYDTLGQYTLDSLHPNKAGMQQLAGAFVRTLSKL